MITLSANFLAFYLGAIFIEHSGIFSGVTVFLLTALAGTIASSKLEKCLSSLMTRAFKRIGDNNAPHPADETLYGRSGFDLTSGRLNLRQAFSLKPAGHRTAQPLLVLLFFLACSIGYLIAGPPAVAAETFAQRYQDYQNTVNAGKAALAKKDYPTAIAQYSTVIRASPFTAAHYHDRGIAWFKNGEAKKAVEDFDRALLLDLRLGAAYSYRGLARLQGGDYTGAWQDYQQALAFNPKDPSVHNNLAWLYATAPAGKLRDGIKALEHAVRAAELSNEKNAEILDTLARAYFVNGKKAEAIEAEQKALRLEPGSREFTENLKQYEAGGK
jgi:tetratricopeptide (TPR) repeat protein